MYLVTGCAGFIGMHLTMSLLKNSGRPIKLTFCIMDELDKIIIKNKSKK